MRNITEEFIPFEHKNLEYINGSLNLARQQRQSGTLEGMMASTLIYTNLVEYLTNNLLENLQQMIFILTYHSFNSVFFVKNKEITKVKLPKTLGQLREILSSYEFPDSQAFLGLLQKFSEVRNAIFHRLLTISKKELDLGIVDKQFSDLRDLAEEILDKYNTIIKGITTTWYTVMRPQIRPQTGQEVLTVEQLQSQIDALLGQLSALQTQLAELQTEERKN